ncbi:aldose epimerase [Massilia sp. WF1]|uniref:D-hexose-6-phosphate mutarotase n=1 Tax=unclassified Massilia TaxID=2609279 RepID=UPI00064A0C2D|nr:MULTISPECIES: D-hexose-6-phosphate mutarotase [unclassified Massilia]ALK98810.1 D-hexose-6-phosphate mutarotase [Massilia sp. WG5]KLU38643.1 aldose epimerase [Massilia sp. WF1]
MSASTIQFGQLPALLLRAPDGAEASITLYGAHLVSWKSVSGTGAAPQERMFMSRLSALDGSRAIRGGVPVIFPQFAERGEGMRHGFARTSTWQVLDSGEQDGAAWALLGLNQDELSPQASSAWAYAFELALRVSVRGAELDMALEVRNIGSHPFSFAAALHTYHLVEDVEAVRIDGLQAETLAITDKLDQVFERIAGPLTFDNGADKLLHSQRGFTDVVVWNPGAADAAALSDLEDEEYRNFVCIEPAMLGPQTLEPGGSWKGEYRLSSIP